MTTLFGRLRAAWRMLTRSQQLENEMRDEMQLHLELEAERLARETQLAPQEARRLAYVRFGGVEKYKDAGRDARGRAGSMRLRSIGASAPACSPSTKG